MDRGKLTKQFYEQVLNFPENAQGLRDALAANEWGRVEIEPIEDIYSDYCRSHNIKIDDPLLANYYTVTAEGKAKEKEVEGRKRINEHIETFKTGGSVADLLDNVTREQQQIKSDRNRFSNWKDYFNNCITYDPSKDFKPSMLAGLRFPNSTLSYIGARPGGGKSTLLVNLAREGLADDRKVFLVNMEMSNKAIITNYALSFMYASANAKQRKELEINQNPQSEYYSLFKRETDIYNTFDDLRHNATEHIKSVLDSTLFIYDGTGGKLEAIIRDIESRVTAGDIVLIDYIQNMPPPTDSNEQRYLQIKKTSRALLDMALKKNIVVISGGQFGRPEKKEKPREAAMEDFRESGDIEQDAHNALGIEDIYDKDGNRVGRYIKVLKMREGGNRYKRQKLDCHFNYLHIAGIEGEYNPKEKAENENPGQPTGNGAVFDWDKV